MKSALKSLQLRYSILRFYYTKLFENFLWGGYTVHPLFFDFPYDDELFRDDITDMTFVIGSTIYVTPVLEEDFETV